MFRSKIWLATSKNYFCSALPTGIIEFNCILLTFSLTGDKKGETKDESIDTVLQYHQNMQEKIADEMIKMAQNLKHTSVMASNIIKEDNKVNSLVVHF